MKVVAPVLPGETMGDKYRVERVLGQGGMGVVVAARHLALDERVAIKFLVGEPSESSIERFLREARAAAKVKGEHVCRVFDFGRLETGEPYIVMEYLDGTDLARKVDNEGRQPPSLVAGWIIEACDALAEAHALGIVHRDLKPANLFVATRPDGSTSTKVLDFGISKLPSQAQMTRTTTMMGSPAYMSPEQMESSRGVDARADVWSLGVVLYELLSGLPPFRGESMIELALRIREREPKPLDDVPEELARVVAKCLAKKASDRYSSVAELAAALAPFAPPEVSGIVARLTRRTTAASSDSERSGEENLALRETVRQVSPMAQSSVGPPTPAELAQAEKNEKLAETKPSETRSPETKAEDTEPPEAKPEQTGRAEAKPEATRGSTQEERKAIAVGQTTLDVDDDAPKRARASLAPLQSTMDPEPARGSKGRGPWVVVGVGALMALAFFGGRAMLAHPVETKPDPTNVPSATTNALPSAVASNAPPPPSASASAAPSATHATVVASGTERHPVAVVPTSKVAASTSTPANAPDAAPPPTVAPSSSASPSASPTTSSTTRKRRELDRTDPL
jgi:serine/threonine-protein kinase